MLSNVHFSERRLLELASRQAKTTRKPFPNVCIRVTLIGSCHNSQKEDDHLGLIARMLFVALLKICMQLKNSSVDKHQRRTVTYSEFQKNGMLTRMFKNMC